MVCTADAVMADKRARIAFALREAGMHNTDYGRFVIT